MATKPEQLLLDTFQSLRSYLDKRLVAQPRSSGSSPSCTRPSRSAPREVSDSEDEGGSVSPDSEEEEDEEKEASSSHYRLSLGEVDDLLKTIHTTPNIKADKTHLSLHDKMFPGVGGMIFSAQIPIGGCKKGMERL